MSEAPEVTTLDLDLLQCDYTVSPRERIDHQQRTLFETLYHEEGLDALPPIVVFTDSETYWVVDGFHRVAALSILHQHERSVLLVPVQLHHGTKREATLFACGSNKHGRSYTTTEKHTAVQWLLTDPEWMTWSDRAIARHCGVGHAFVSRLRQSLSTRDSDQEQNRTYKTRWGNQGTMNVANIGRQPLPGQAPKDITPYATNPEDVHRQPQQFVPIVTQGLDVLKQTGRDFERALNAATPEAIRTYLDN